MPRLELCRRLACAAVLLILLLVPRSAGAYAWMIKYGFSECASCHTDPAGGETLTGMGRAQAERLLSAGGQDDATPSEAAQFLFGVVKEPDGVRLGGSFRHLVLYSAAVEGVPSSFRQFPMQLDVYGSARVGRAVFGASLGVARGIEGSAHVRGAQLNQEAGKGFIVLSRNHYAGLWLADDTLLRVGRLSLPVGVRIPEHTLWVRESTRTDRESDQQHGASLTYMGGRWRSDAMIIFGNFQLNPDRYRERGVAGTLEYLVAPTLAVGGSALLTLSREDALTRVDNAIRYVYGINARYGISPKLAALGEFDILKEAGRKGGLTGFVQLDYEPLRGLHLMLTGEVLDQGLLDRDDVLPVRGAGAARYGSWISVDWFFMNHFELRVDAVMRQEDVFHGQAQLHIYF